MAGFVLFVIGFFLGSGSLVSSFIDCFLRLRFLWYMQMVFNSVYEGTLDLLSVGRLCLNT